MVGESVLFFSFLLVHQCKPRFQDGPQGLFFGFDVFHILKDCNSSAIGIIAFQQTGGVGHFCAAWEDKHDSPFEQVENRYFPFVFFRVKWFHVARVIKAGVVPLDALPNGGIGIQNNLADRFHDVAQVRVEVLDQGGYLFGVGLFLCFGHEWLCLEGRSIGLQMGLNLTLSTGIISPKGVFGRI